MLEYVLGTNPRSFDNAGNQIEWKVERMSDLGIPGSSTSAETTRHLTVLIHRDAPRTDAQITIEISPDLASWHSEAEGWVQKVIETPQTLKFMAAGSTVTHPTLLGRVRASRINP